MFTPLFRLIQTSPMQKTISKNKYLYTNYDIRTVL